MPNQLPLVYSTLGCPDWSLERMIEQAVADGYAGLEIRVLDGQIIPSDMPAQRRKEIRDLMRQNGLVIAGLGASTRFSSPDPAERRKNQEELRRYLELANDLESPMVRTFGGGVAEGHTIEQTIDWLAEGLAGVMETAVAQGVTVLLETHDAFCRGQEVAATLAKVEHPNLKAVWDTHHPYRMGESVADTWKYLGHRLAHVHIKDARRRPDGEWDLVLLGEGEVPNREVVELLLAKGYSGYLSAEWEKKWHPSIEEPEIALPQHARVLREWMEGKK